MTQRSRLLGWAVNLALAAFSFAFAFGVFEVGLRLAGYRALYEMYSKPSLFWRYDPLLGWSHEPGASGRYIGPRPWPVEFGALVTINSLGLRGPELAPRGPDELRVLFLGDSMVAGFEVEYDQTFEALLEQRLSRDLGRPVRTINAGVRGYGTDQYYLYYVERGRLLAPDAVVVFHSGNDPADNATLHETRRPFGKGALVPEPNGGLRREGFPVPQYPVCEEVTLSADYQVVRKNSAVFQLVCQAQMALFDHSAVFSFLTISVPWNSVLLRNLYYFGNKHTELLYDPNMDRHIEHTEAIALALVHEIRADGAAAIWTGWPPEAPRQQLMLRDLESGGAVVSELAPLTELPRESISFKHDSHFNAEGHRRVAEILAPTIEAALRAHRPPAEGSVR